MISARTWKVVLGCSLLFMCFCTGSVYLLFDIDNIHCQLKYLFPEVGAVQARMDAQIELVTGVVGPDRSVTSIKWGGKVRLRIEEYACGYEAHWSRAYGSDDSPAEVLARFRQRLVGWQVERESEDVIYLKNRDNTARLKLTIIRPRKTPHDDFDFGPSLSSAAPGTPTVYEIDLRLANLMCGSGDEHSPINKEALAGGVPMISARTWKVVLGCSLLVVCYCAALGYYFLDIDNIQCRIRHPTIDTGPAQARFTEYQRAFTSAIQGDQLLRQDQSEEPIEVHIGELYCGCAYGYTVYVYRSQESAERVIERFANDIHVPGWRVRFSNAEWVQYRNADNTVRAKIRIQSERQRLPAVYEVIFSFAEPSHPECHETGE